MVVRRCKETHSSISILLEAGQLTGPVVTLFGLSYTREDEDVKRELTRKECIVIYLNYL
jgi:hypothetical protein